MFYSSLWWVTVLMLLADGPSVMSQLSGQWKSLSDADKQEWKVKATDNFVSALILRTRAVRDLTSAVEQNIMLFLPAPPLPPSPSPPLCHQ